VLEVKPAKEIRGKTVLAPNPDMLLCISVCALAAQKKIQIEPAPDTPLCADIRETISSFADIAQQGAAWHVEPKSDASQDIRLGGDEMRFREFLIFALLGLGKTIAFDSLPEKRLAAWRSYAQYAACDIETKTLDDGACGISLAARDAFSIPPRPVEANLLHACFGLALGLRRAIDITIEYPFATPLRHLLPACGYSLTVKSVMEGKESNLLSRRMRFLRQKKKTDSGLLYAITADFANPSPEPCTLTLPGDDILCSLLVAAKSLVQKGNLIIENALLEPWATPLLGLVRKMGCRPAIQESGETSLGRIGMIQLQRFELAGRKTECIPFFQFAGHLPSMVALSCFAQGQSVFRRLGDLRNDEPDGIEQILECVRTLGGRHGEMPDGIVVDGLKQLDGFDLEAQLPATLSGAFAVAGLKCMGNTTIADQAISRRWPRFASLLDEICDYRK
jgi:hypothetical protein